MKLTKTKRKELKPGDMFCMPYEQPVSEVYMVLRENMIDSLSNAEILRIEPDDPENAEPEPKAEMITGYCRYCPKIFKYPNVYGLAEMIHAHEATCPERPKGDDVTLDETDMPIVPEAQAEQGAGT